MHVHSAPIWKRALAWIYDALIVAALFLFATLIAAVLAGGPSPPWLTQIFITIFTIGYFWVSWRKGGRTAGMRAWRLRVVTTEGDPLSHGQALTRIMVCIATAAPLFLPLFTGYLAANKQTIYDRLSNTRVVTEPRPAESAQ